MQTLARFVLFNPYLLLLEAFYVYLSNLKNPSAVVFSKLSDSPRLEGYGINSQRHSSRERKLKVESVFPENRRYGRRSF